MYIKRDPRQIENCFQPLTGLTPSYLQAGHPLDFVQRSIKQLLKGNVVIGFDLKFVFCSINMSLIQFEHIELQKHYCKISNAKGELLPINLRSSIYNYYRIDIKKHVQCLNFLALYIMKIYKESYIIEKRNPKFNCEHIPRLNKINYIFKK